MPITYQTVKYGSFLSESNWLASACTLSIYSYDAALCGLLVTYDVVKTGESNVTAYHKVAPSYGVMSPSGECIRNKQNSSVRK